MCTPPPALRTTPTGAQDEMRLEPQLQGKFFYYIIYIYLNVLQIDYTHRYHHHHHHTL